MKRKTNGDALLDCAERIAVALERIAASLEAYPVVQTKKRVQPVELIEPLAHTEWDSITYAIRRDTGDAQAEG